MAHLTWLWTTVRAFAWWQTTLWIVYTIYFGLRSWHFWEETETGLWKGYRNVIFGYEKEIRVYHIFRILFDIPPAIVGLFFPILRSILRFKIYEFKDEKAK